MEKLARNVAAKLGKEKQELVHEFKNLECKWARFVLERQSMISKVEVPMLGEEFAAQYPEYGKLREQSDVARGAAFE